MPKASVKIMLSYDYCHFEICLGTDDNLSNKEVNELRKDAQRLADEAVRQYIVAKKKANLAAGRLMELRDLEKEIERIKNKPESEWTATEKAKTKALKDEIYWQEHSYDYEDDEPLDL